MLVLFLSLCAATITLSVGYLIVERELDTQRAREAALAEDQKAALRKKRAKRSNERLKLASTFSNGLGVAFIATSVLAPMASDRSVTPYGALLAALIALILHLVGQFMLHFWKSED